MSSENGRRINRVSASRRCGSFCISRRSQGLSHLKSFVSNCICFIVLFCIISSVEWKLVDAFVPLRDRRSSSQSLKNSSHRRLIRAKSGAKIQLSMMEGDPLAWMAPLMASVDIPDVWLNSDALVTQACTAAFFAGLGDIMAQSLAASQKLEMKRRLDENEPNINESVEISRDFSMSVSAEYDLRRTLNYFLKGLGGGCMWSVWFLFSDPISLDLTHRILQAAFLNTNTELAYAVQYGDIDVATASSVSLSTVIPLDLGAVITISGRDLQHLIRVCLCIALEQCFVSPLFFTMWDIPIPALLSGSPVRQLPAQIQAKLVPLLIANAKVWTPANVITYSLPTEHRVLFASLTDVLWQTILSQITSNEITLQPPPPIPTDPLPEILTSASTTNDVNIVSRTTSVNTANPSVMASNPISSITTPILSGGMTSTSLFQTNGNEK